MTSLNTPEQPRLLVANSITKTNDIFEPAQGNQVSWYICGPTVYDHSHLGHARNYLSFDILRRIMSDYFQYDVFYVMNITDIDDKIIIKTYQQRLAQLEALIRSEAVFSDYRGSEQGIQTLNLVENTLKISKKITELSEVAANLIAEVKEKVGEANLPGAFTQEFNVQEEFLKLASFYEQDFLNDMDALNVRRPDALTRVSEYIPEIIKFVEEIIKNGYAYESDGDVYFDVAQFLKDGYSYKKCSPPLNEKELADLLNEGEGSLFAGSKRDARDFALWKSSKPGEPRWDSPWGIGRPGWHIECSAMASDLLGSNVDINCGGIDLRFPHHDNQLAQSEARFGCKQWVKYFLHSGHLHISGLKMSKSLKNFITIKSSLQNYTPNQLRFLFLLHRYNTPLDIDLRNFRVQIKHATIQNNNVTEILRAQIVNDKLVLPIGTNLSGLLQIDNLQGPLVIGYTLEEIVEKEDKTIDVVSSVTLNIEWEVVNGVLLDGVALGGQVIPQLDEAVSVERVFTDFFLNIRTLLRLQRATTDQATVAQKWTSLEHNLNKVFQETQKIVHESLLDNFNTPQAVEALQQVVRATNSYIKDNGVNSKAMVLLSIAKYVTKILTVFGVSEERPDAFGLSWELSDPSIIEVELSQLLDDFCARRDAVRAAARAKQPSEQILELLHHNYDLQQPAAGIVLNVRRKLVDFLTELAAVADKPVALLSICDRIRDADMLRFGVRFEDDTYVKGKSIWKLDSVRSTLADREKRKVELASAAAKKAELQAKKEEEARKKAAIAAIPKEDFFKLHPTWAGKFSAYDETGFPTATADGKPVSKGMLKKLQTALQKHVAGK